MTFAKRSSVMSTGAARVPAAHSESRKRTVSVNVRLTPAEAELAHELADRLGCKSLPELLRIGFLIIQAEEARDAIRS